VQEARFRGAGLFAPGRISASIPTPIPTFPHYPPCMATVRQRKRGVWEVRVFAGRDGNNKPVQILGEGQLR